MSPTELAERVATLEAETEALKKDSEDFRTFKETMIKELAELVGEIKMVNWKVSATTGAVVFILTQFSDWIKKLLN